MIKTIKPPAKEGAKDKEEDKHSSQYSDMMGRTKHKFHPVKNSTKIIIEEHNKPHVIFHLIYFKINSIIQGKKLCNIS